MNVYKEVALASLFVTLLVISVSAFVWLLCVAANMSQQDLRPQPHAYEAIEINGQRFLLVPPKEEP